MVDCIRHLNTSTTIQWSAEKQELEDFSFSKKKFFVRTTASKDKVRDVFKDVDFVDGGVDGEIGFVTSVMSENDFKAKAGTLGIVSRIRLDD